MYDLPEEARITKKIVYSLPVVNAIMSNDNAKAIDDIMEVTLQYCYKEKNVLFKEALEYQGKYLVKWPTIHENIFCNPDVDIMNSSHQQEYYRILAYIHKDMLYNSLPDLKSFLKTYWTSEKADEIYKEYNKYVQDQDNLGSTYNISLTVQPMGDYSTIGYDSEGDD